MRRVLILVIFIILVCNAAFAQVFRFGVPNLELYDKQRFHAGFSLGIDIVDVNIKTRTNYSSPDISPENKLLQIYSKASPAFNVGIVANMRLGEYFDLRFIPGFSIAHDINLYYRFEHKMTDPNPSVSGVLSNEILRKIECHFINFPLFIKFKSSRMHNVRIYALAGAQVGVNMMSAKNNKIILKDQNVVIPVIKPYDVQVKGGFGFDFYTTYFKFSTEFKVSYGVINMLENEKGIRDKEHIDAYLSSATVRGLKSLKSKTFTISFTFE